MCDGGLGGGSPKVGKTITAEISQPGTRAPAEVDVAERYVDPRNAWNPGTGSALAGILAVLAC